MTTKILKNIYYDPKNPAAFSTAKRLYHAARLRDPGITLNQVKDWLSSQITYSLHKPIQRKFKRNPVVVDHVDEQWQGDLVDVQEFARQNNGNRYILTIVDILSKYAWAVPLKNKKGESVRDAIKTIFKDRYPTKFQTDQGTEFLNRQVQTYLKGMGIHFFTSQNQDVKCAVVERFNRTLRNRMFKYFTANGTRKYIDILPKLLDAYNHTIHRTTKKRPVDVNEDNEHEVFQNTYGVSSMREYLKRKEKSPSLAIGANVRVPYKKETFQRGYYPQWTDQVFTVSNIQKGRRNAMYKLAHHDGTELRPRHYKEQIQRITPVTYRVDKIVKRKTINGKLMYYVSFIGYPPKYNEWIPAEDIVNIGDA